MNKILIYICFLLAGPSVLGQTSDTIKDLPAEQVEVIKQFEALLEDARKVNVVPEPPAQRVLEKFDYNVNIRPLLLEYPDPQIKPVAVKTEPRDKAYNGLLRIAAGNLNTLDAGFCYNVLTRQETEIDFSVNYLTMNNKKERFQQIEKFNANLKLNHSLNSLVAFSADLGYHQEGVGFYGSPLDFIAQDTSIYFRRLVDYSLGFNVHNPEENEFGIDYILGFSFENFSLKDEALMENNLLVDANLKKNINEHFKLGLSGKVDISNIIDTSSTLYNNYFISPGLSYNSEYFRFDGAVLIGFTSAKTYFLPNVELAFSAFDYALVPFAFWKGNLQKNNVQQLLSYNPYLNLNIVPNLSNSIVMRYGVGIRGSVKNFLYEASVGYGKTDDLLLFKHVLNDQDLRQFEIIKDTSNVLDIDLSANYLINEKLSLNTNFSFTDYSIIAWHLPSYTFDFGLSYYALSQKLKISPSLYIRDGVTVMNDESNVEELPYMLDLNLHLDYHIRSEFSVYAQLNNILSSEYQQWYDYSNFGINAKAGLKVRF